MDQKKVPKIKAKKTGLCIIFSGQHTTGKSTIVKYISKKLAMRYISAGEGFRKLAKEKNQTLKEFLKQCPKSTHKKIDMDMLKAAAKGNIIIDSHISGHICKKYSDINILVRCSTEKRIERLAKKKNITIKKATQALKERDMLEEKTFCELYNIRFSDRSPYSLIIDTSNIAKEEMKKKCLKTITKTMTRLKKQQNS